MKKSVNNVYDVGFLENGTGGHHRRLPFPGRMPMLDHEGHTFTLRMMS